MHDRYDLDDLARRLVADSDDGDTLVGLPALVITLLLALFLALVVAGAGLALSVGYGPA
jgi:hypothetical protein